MKITEETTFAELTVELGKLGVIICQMSVLPDGRRQCDVANSRWARGTGQGVTEAEALDAALKMLIQQIGILLGKPPVSLDE